jgi:hypothetical protein
VLDPAASPIPPSRITRGLPAILDHLLVVGLAHDPGSRPGRASDLILPLQEIGRHYGAFRIPLATLRRSS